jgi:hypothetical protein
MSDPLKEYASVVTPHSPPSSPEATGVRSEESHKTGIPDKDSSNWMSEGHFDHLEGSGASTEPTSRLSAPDPASDPALDPERSTGLSSGGSGASPGCPGGPEGSRSPIGIPDALRVPLPELPESDLRARARIALIEAEFAGRKPFREPRVVQRVNKSRQASSRETGPKSPLSSLNAGGLRARSFLAAYVARGGIPGSMGPAWRDAFPDRAANKSDKACAQAGSRLLAKLKANGAFLEMMDAVGLGDTRLLAEIEARLTAMRTQGYAYRGEVIEREYEDNQTRMAATQLLMRLRGRDVTKVEQTVQGMHAVVVVPAEMDIEAWRKLVSTGEQVVVEGSDAIRSDV